MKNLLLMSLLGLTVSLGAFANEKICSPMNGHYENSDEACSVGDLAKACEGITYDSDKCIQGCKDNMFGENNKACEEVKSWGNESNESTEVLP